MEEMHRASCVGRSKGLLCRLLKPQSQQSVFTNREALQTLHFKDLYVGMTAYIIGHWWLTQLPACPNSSQKVAGWDWKFQPSKQVAGSPGNQFFPSPTLRRFPSYHIIINSGVIERGVLGLKKTRHSFHRYHSHLLGNSEGSKSSVVSNLMKTKYRFLYYKSQSPLFHSWF